MKERISNKTVSLPDELPLPKNLSVDNATEELLSQNQDLMARLAVALRRNADLQHKIEQLDKNILHLKEQNQYISDASLENRERLDNKEKELRHWRQKLRQQEIDYAELYEQYNNKDRDLSEQVEQLQRALKSHEKYRQKIQEKMRPYINELYAKIGLLQSQLKEKESEMLKLIQVKGEQYEYLSEKIQDLSRGIEDQKTAYESRLQHMEEILASETKKLQESEEKLAEMRRKYKVMKDLDDEYTLARNRNIVLERERFETERKFEEEIRKLQKQISDLKRENKELRSIQHPPYVEESGLSFID